MKGERKVKMMVIGILYDFRLKFIFQFSVILNLPHICLLIDT